MRRINKCTFLSIFALIYFKLLLQIVLLFPVKYCTLAIESNRQKHFLIIYLLLFIIYYFPTIKITQALHYTKMWRGDLRKPQGLYEEAPSLQ